MSAIFTKSSATSGHIQLQTFNCNVFPPLGVVSPSEERVQVALEELQDLKGVWCELARIWEQIDELKEKPWLSVAPRKLRQSLDGLMTSLKGLPGRLRQYASYEHVQRVLKGYAKVLHFFLEFIFQLYLFASGQEQPGN